MDRIDTTNIATWTCTKRVMKPWDTTRQTGAIVEFDGARYRVGVMKDGNCTSVVCSTKDRDEAVESWANLVKLMKPTPLFPKTQCVLPGFESAVADYDIVETAKVAVSTYTWKSVA